MAIVNLVEVFSRCFNPCKALIDLTKFDLISNYRRSRNLELDDLYIPSNYINEMIVYD